MQTRKISELKPYKNNARTHSPEQIGEIARSIAEFGFNNPVLIDEKNNVIAGHGRILAAGDLGLDTIPVMVLDHLTETKKRAYILADNRIALNAGWSPSLLKEEFDSLLAEDFDVTLTGFTMDEIFTFTNPEVLNDGECDPDAVPTIPDVPVSVLGDVWILGNHRLMCGDSTEPTAVARLLGENKPDLVFTDPPYGIKIVTATHQVGADFGIAKKGKYEPIIGDNSIQTAIDAYNLCVSLNIPKLIFWGGNYYATGLGNTSCWLIWDKREDSGIKNSFADCEIAWTNFKKPSRIYRQLWNGMIRKGESEKRVHPTQKPIALVEWCFVEYGEDDNNVLDLFGGSGTTLIACEKTGRKCFMIELSPQYCDVIVSRWQKFTGQDAKLESTGITFNEAKDGRETRERTTEMGAA